MKTSQRFKAPSTKRPNNHPFAAENLLLSTKRYNLKHHHRIMKQSQRKRSRITLLFALVSILSTLLVLANLFFAPTAANTSYNTIEETFTIHNNRRQQSIPLEDKRKQRTLQYNRSEDRYNRQIQVVEYTDVFSVGTADNNNNDTSQPKASEWSPKQMQEMEKYYQRYLQVFHEKHGYDYEPEDKEVVYREYLAYRERKMKEIQERKQKQAMEQEAAMRKKATELRQQQEQQSFHKALSSTPSKTKESSRKNETVRNNNNNNNDGNHPIETPHRVVADQILVKPAPFTLELEIADTEQQATEDGSLSNNRNYTATIVTGGASPATTFSIR